MLNANAVDTVALTKTADYILAFNSLSKYSITRIELMLSA